MATLTTAIRLNTPQELRIVGTEGHIAIPHWWRPSEINISRRGETETRRFDVQGEGFQYEIMAVSDYIRAGATESEIMPLDETLAIMGTLDRMRAGWGLRYPFEG